MSEPKKIFELIPKVMADVGVIGKNGHNDFDKYKFRSIDDVYNKLQPALSKHGVFTVPNVLESHEERFKSAKGTDQVRVKLKVKYTIYASDGSSVETTVEGEAIDRSDKATNKALTAAFKYMLIQVFCIAVEGMDDADKDPPELSFINEKPPVKNEPAKVVAPRAPAPQDLKITDGKFKGQKLSEIQKDDLKKYIQEVCAALSSSGKKEPKWFQEIRKVSGY